MSDEPLPPPPPLRVLDYETVEDSTVPISRPKWVYAVLGLYGILLLAVLSFPIWIVFVMDGPKDDLKTYAYLGFCSSSLLLVGMTLMIIPIQKRARRPVKRRAIWLPLVGSSILFAALVFFTIWAVQDAFPWLIDGTGGPDPEKLVWYGAPLAWAAWFVLFGWMALVSDPVSVNSRMYKTLATGNFLELVIAVPMHVVARQRPECCAGLPSGIAIGTGAAIAIVALGPAIFFLYYRRWKQVYGK